MFYLLGDKTFLLFDLKVLALDDARKESKQMGALSFELLWFYYTSEH